MSPTVRAHYDGKQVVLDEPAPFAPGEKLLVSRPSNGSGLDPASPQEEERSYPTFGEVFASRPDPEDESNELYDAIVELRSDRRRWAAEKADEDLWT